MSMSRRFRLMNLVLVSGGALAALAVGCSSSSTPDEPGAGDPDGGAGAPGAGGGLSARGDASVWTALGIDDPKPPQVKYDEIVSPYPEDAASCKAFPSAYPVIHSCACDNCLSLQRQCDALQGCTEIAECGVSIGCTDAFSCYLFPADPKCIPVVDKWGNSSVSSALSLQLGDCTIAAKCR